MVVSITQQSKHVVPAVQARVSRAPGLKRHAGHAGGTARVGTSDAKMPDPHACQALSRYHVMSPGMPYLSDLSYGNASASRPR